MKLIQLILIPILVILVAVYFGRLRSGSVDRILVVLFGVLGSVMVAIPEWTNTVAHLVGVGRGTDLVIYFSLVGCAFLFLILYSKCRVLAANVTILARSQAMENAKIPAKGTHENTS